MIDELIVCLKRQGEEILETEFDAGFPETTKFHSQSWTE